MPDTTERKAKLESRLLQLDADADRIKAKRQAVQDELKGLDKARAEQPKRGRAGKGKHA